MPRNMVSGMLRGGLYTRVVGKRLLYFRHLASTMDEAARMAQEGTETGTVVLAEEQSAARGRFRRPWFAPPGNLYLSVVLRPSTEALHYLSIMSGVAVVRAIRKARGIRPTIKWPNDVMISGKKVCGILVENSLKGDTVQHSVLGIGVNVALDPSAVDELSGKATSLNRETETEVNREALLRHLLQELDNLYLPLRQARGASTDAGGSKPVMEEWRGLLETLGKQVEVAWLDDVYRGYAEDVDDVGNLLLRLEDGSVATLPAGEVTSAKRVQT